MRFFRKLSVIQRLYLILPALVVSGGLVGWAAFEGMKSNSRGLIEARMLKELTVTAMNLVLRQDDVTKAMLIDPEKVFELSEAKIEAYDAGQAAFTEMKEMTQSEDVLGLIHRLERIDAEELRPLDTALLEKLFEGDGEGARSLYFGEYEDVRIRFEGALQKLGESAEVFAADAEAFMEIKNRTSLQRIVVLLIVGTFVVAVLLVKIVGRLNRELSSSVKQISRDVDASRHSSRHLLGASEELAMHATEQSHAVESTGEALQKIARSISSNAASAQSANELAQKARKAAEKGAGTMREMADAMSEIKAASDNIVKIIKSIDGIAFQTNILSLNAAVEAARAGEAGLGFAVVADEVRKLAQRSAEAARESNAIVGNTLDKCARGIEVCDSVNRDLDEIFEHVKTVDDLVSTINEASGEQDMNIYEVNESIAKLESTISNNTASAEETAATAKEMDGRSQGLGVTIATLQKLSGKRSSSTDRKPADTGSSFKLPDLPPLWSGLGSAVSGVGTLARRIASKKTARKPDSPKPVKEDEKPAEVVGRN